MKKNQTTQIVKVRYKNRSVAHIVMLSIVTAILHYLLIAIFRQSAARVHLFAAWPALFCTSFFVSRRIIKNGLLTVAIINKTFLYSITVAGVVLAIGQFLVRELTSLNFTASFWLVFGSDIIVMSLITATLTYYRMAKFQAKRRDQEMKTYEELGKRLIMNVRRLETWEDIAIETNHLFPGIVEKIKSSEYGFTDQQVRLIIYLKFNFSPQKIQHMEGITPGALRKRKSRIKGVLGGKYLEFMESLC